MRTRTRDDALRSQQAFRAILEDEHRVRRLISCRFELKLSGPVRDGGAQTGNQTHR